MKLITVLLKGLAVHVLLGMFIILSFSYNYKFVRIYDWI